MHKRIAWLAIVAGLVAMPVLAQTPGGAAAASRHPYEITPEAGAWCICVHSFFEHIEPPLGRDFRPGELDALLARSRARTLAIEFVTLLRGEYKLPAYMFNRGDEERKKEEDRIAKERAQREKLYRDMGAELPPKTYRKRLAHIQDQYIVLIGGYPDQESAVRSREFIRKLEMPKDEQIRDKFLSKVVAGFGGPATVGTSGQKADGHGMYVNPFKSSMVVPNPMAPRIKPPEADREELMRGLAELNAKNPYSLLKHGGKITLVVKMYRIPAAVGGLDDKGDIRRASANNMDKIYEATAKQAEALAALLRHPQLNFESYVLHTHASSMVTVGIFESDQDPRLAPLQARLATLRIDPEQLMNPPLPIPIPRGR